MYYSKQTLFICALAMLFAGCATLNRSKQGVEIIGPANVQVESVEGGELPAAQGKSGITVYPDPATTDSVRIVYENQSATIALAKNPNTYGLFDCIAFGLPFFVDDIDHAWFNYAPVYVTVDSGSNGLHGISASSENWLGEAPGARQLDALVLLGVGFAGLMSQDSGLPVPFSSDRIAHPALTFQAGIGVDYRKMFELFYLFRDEPAYPVSKEGSETATITAGDLCLRYFFQKRFFLQCSYGKGVASDYSMYDFQMSEPPFTEAGAAIGWAGDISYISLQYFAGLTDFNVPYAPSVRYHTIYLNFGMSLRI